MDLKADMVIADRFRLVRPLGEGGMGAVWLADHISLKTSCAVKFMRPEVAAEPQYRARFDREAQAAARIRSPHVVHVIDHGVWEQAPYIAMEFLEGEDLAQRIERLGRLSPEDTVAIVAQVARALTKAHAAGLVHRDLKPANIFLVHDDDREIVKVLDFGIAKSNSPTTGSQTKTGAVVGTPYYMSPEQAQGTKAVDHRTDLWALGVVAYQCLTGTLPFVSDAFGDLVLKIIVEPLPVPSQIAPVPAGFDAWWARAVSRDPAGRFQSAKEMADALATALDVRAPVEGVGAPSVVGNQIPGLDRPKTPVNNEVPAGTASTTEPSVANVAAPAGGRSRVLAVVAVGAIAVLGVVGYLARSGSTTTPITGTHAATQPTAEVTASATVTAPAPVVTASAEASAVPAASVTASASAAPVAPAASSAAPAVSVTARPIGTAKPSAKHAPTAGPQPGHDIGF